MSPQPRYPIVEIGPVAWDERGVPVIPTIKFTEWRGPRDKLEHRIDPFGQQVSWNSEFVWEYMGSQLVSFRRKSVLRVEFASDGATTLELMGTRGRWQRFVWSEGSVTWRTRRISNFTQHGLLAFVLHATDVPTKEFFIGDKKHGLWKDDGAKAFWLGNPVDLAKYVARLPTPVHLSRLGASPAVARHICKFV